MRTTAPKPRNITLIPTLSITACTILLTMYSKHLIWPLLALLFFLHELLSSHQKQDKQHFVLYLVLTTVLAVKIIIMTSSVHVLNILYTPSLSSLRLEEAIILVIFGALFIWFFTCFMFMKYDYAQLQHSYKTLRAHTDKKINDGIQALVKSEQQYQSLFEEHPDAVFSLDQHGNFQSVNRSCMNILGYSSQELIGQSLLNYMAEKDRKIVQNYMRAAKEGMPQSFEIHGWQKAGQSCYFHITLIPAAVGGVSIGTYGIARDMTQLKQNQQQVEYMAFHDVLTGMANRRKFENDLTDALYAGQMYNMVTAVLFIDLDRFKSINDLFGHTVGDQLLIETANRLKRYVRKKDIVARQGGDEFTILLTQMFSPKNVITFAENLLKVFQQPFLLGGQELYITPSIGIALAPAHGTTAPQLIKNADTAMYEAKATGKNKYVLYTDEMSKAEQKRNMLEKELRKAIQNEELLVHYQPQVHMHAKQIIGFEALVRWKHPKLGMISPADFIPLAEETGLILPIGEWVLRQACKQAKQWHEKGYPSLKIGVNLSPIQFIDPNLVQLVTNALQEAGLPPEALDLEITEGIAMRNEQLVIEKLQQLQSLGIKISIDDFGTGYSSLSYLTKYPIHTLKIAREFIQEIEHSLQEEAVISSIIMMAKNLRLTVIAEGVETEKQWNFLTEQQCDQIQGYYVSKPLEAKQTWELLEKEMEKAV